MAYDFHSLFNLLSCRRPYKYSNMPIGRVDVIWILLLSKHYISLRLSLRGTMRIAIDLP